MSEKWPPDYYEEFARRQRAYQAMREHPELIVGALEYYRERPIEFIEDWCETYDPRNAGTELPTYMPFILFERQKEFVSFLLGCLHDKESGLVEKARDMGATWLCCAFSVWLWLFWPGAAVGWGSRKAEYVDKIGVLDSIFEKIRVIIRRLPHEFWPAGFDPESHMSYMKILNPATGSTISGESGDNIGRGGRTLIYFKDESAHYERPEKIEAALADNTNVQIDISSVNGTGNVFHRRRENGVDWSPNAEMPKGRTRVFVFDWSHHPAKTREWYEQRRRKAIDDGLLHLFRQEVERDYAGAVEGLIIPPEWVEAAIDAHIALGFDDSGGWCAALDVADGGGDLNALAARKGVVLRYVDEWGAPDVGESARRAFGWCAALNEQVDLEYDCIGVGSAVKSEAARLQSEKGDDGNPLLPRRVTVVAWNAADSPLDPDKHMEKLPSGVDDKNSPLNKDFYQNLKAQGWWQLRRRFERTWRARNEGIKYPPDQLISIPSGLPNLYKVRKELSQPVAGKSASLKLMVEKTPEGTKSPNIGDSIMMAYWPVNAKRIMKVSADAFQALRRAKFR